MVLPVLVAVALGLVWLVALAATQVRVVDAARETARAAARDDGRASAVALGRRVAPDGATDHRAATTETGRGPGAGDGPRTAWPVRLPAGGRRARRGGRRPGAADEPGARVVAGRLSGGAPPCWPSSWSAVLATARCSCRRRRRRGRGPAARRVGGRPGGAGRGRCGPGGAGRVQRRRGLCPSQRRPAGRVRQWPARW